MNSQFLAFLESLKDESTTALLESITEAYSVLFEEPHILINGDKELHNNVPTSELSRLLKTSTSHDINELVKSKKDLYGNKVSSIVPTIKQPITLDNSQSVIDAFDLYMEETGVKREDGQIHEPIKYISDIYNGKLVISPKSNTPIKISDKYERKLFMDSLASSPFAVSAIIQYLLDDKYKNPSRGIDKAILMPDTFYSQIQGNDILNKARFIIGNVQIDFQQALKDLKHKPSSVYESKA